ncbi:MAG: hypothetical protein HDS41_04465 [Bacteroides sp.]|nr:hypothetical protein [Bacteroides sp.]
MDENSTPSRVNNSKSANAPLPQPSKRTLEFIRQFARCYHVSHDLPGEVNSIILN